MKILSAPQIRQADAATIQQEPVSAIDLMERASMAFADEFLQHFADQSQPVYVLCGPGNNGGDGLAVARMLLLSGYQVQVFAVSAQGSTSESFNINCERLQQQSCTLQTIETAQDIPAFPDHALIIDGLFGSGLSRKIEGVFATLIQAVNESKATVVAIDIPSGLYADKVIEKDAPVVKAAYTWTFQTPKLAFLLPQNESIVGNWQILDIGLDTAFLDQVVTDYYYVEPAMVKALRRQRPLHSHKGDYGKTILIAGSYGKMGAAVLSAHACLRSGVGLLTVHVPQCGYQIMQIANPEAMTTVDPHEQFFTTLAQEGRTSLDGYDVVGVGPGLGTAEATVAALTDLLKEAKRKGMRMVLDADALNICGKHRELLKEIPKDSILTPHPKEFERLTEKAKDDFHRLELLKDFATENKVYVTLKGSHTAIATPEGKVYFNSTGNPGMATGGTGDVLTGVLTAMISQKYASQDAALLGVYLHGLAGNIAAEKLSQEAMTASDVVACLGEAFKTLD